MGTAAWIDCAGHEISWTVTRDVLRRTTACAVKHGAEYDVPHGGRASEQYAGEVVVDRRRFTQNSWADCTYRLTWPGSDIRVSSTMRVDVTAAGYDVEIDADAYEDEQLVSRRTWFEHMPRCRDARVGTSRSHATFSHVEFRISWASSSA